MYLILPKDQRKIPETPVLSIVLFNIVFSGIVPIGNIVYAREQLG